MAAVTREMKTSMSQAPRTEVAPNLTITSFFDGMITTDCSWYPLAAKASLGAFGHRQGSRTHASGDLVNSLVD